MMTDIVVTTCDRLDLFKQTIQYILDRTVSSYRLTIVDDASVEGNVEYIKELLARGNPVRTAIFHPERMGNDVYLQNLLQVTRSDPIVFTDDDVLCPLVKPDWLAQGLKAMQQYPDVWALALNNPECVVRYSRKRVVPGPVITTCKYVGGTFLFIRRKALQGYVIPKNSSVGPIKTWLNTIRSPKFERIAYLTNVYCQHIGVKSMRTGDDLTKDHEKVLPIDKDTLLPPEEFRG